MWRLTSMLSSLFFMIGTLLSTLACGENDTEISVSLALDWYPNSNHIGLFIAQEKGYFEDENLKVKLYTPVDPSSVLQTVGNDSDDFGMSYQPDVILARAQGVPVVSVMGIVQHPLNSVMALKSSGITRPSHLIGKKVGYPGIPTDEPLLRTMLKSDGGHSLNDIELINVGFDLGPALISGRVDAIVGAYWTHESIMLENEGYPVNVMRMEEWGVPDYYELVLVVSEKTLRENSDMVKRFVRAVKRGFEEAIVNPQEGVDILLKGTSGEIDEAIERPGANLLVPMWKTEQATFGQQKAARWNDFIQWMRDTELLDPNTDIGSPYTSQFEDN